MKVHASVDGAATVDSPDDLGGVFTPIPTDISIGYGDTGVTPTGLFMQRVAWWNRALTNGERAALYTGQFYGSGMVSPTYAYPTAGTKVASVTVLSGHGRGHDGVSLIPECVVDRTVDVVVT